MMSTSTPQPDVDIVTGTDLSPSSCPTRIQCAPSCSTSNTLASVITAIITTLLATVIFVLVLVAVCKYHPKFTSGAETGSGLRERQGYELVDGNEGGANVNDPIYADMRERDLSALQPEENEPYEICALQPEENEPYEILHL